MELLGRAGDLLFPPKCLFCRRIIGQGTVCGPCMERLPRCGRVQVRGEYYERCAAPLFYTDQVRRAMLAYKFGGKRAYAEGFARLLARTVIETFEGEYDLVTWVPVSARRLRKRGFDQSRLLAERTAALLGKRAVPVLHKTRHTKANSSLKGREKRAANVAGAYVVRDEAAVRGRCVLLMDDIVTTGATFSECGKVLLRAGAEKVICAAVCAARGVKTGKN